VISPGAVVDVVVVTWNTRELTLTSLTSLMTAMPEAGVQLVVHDNGSSDGTAAAIGAAFPDADVEASEENLGFAGGVNRALARTTSPWVLLLNSDAWPEPGAIDELIACAGRHPRAAVVVPKLLRPDGSLEASTWPLPTSRTAASSAIRPLRYVWGHDAERAVGWAVGAAWLIRREALTAIGPLDDSLFMYAEDLDWCWRAHQAGWEVWFTPAAVVRHVGNASGERRFGDERSAAWINNTIRVYRKHRSRVASLVWQQLNAVGARLAQQRAIHADQPELAARWKAQVRQWRQPPHDDRAPSSP
jgi:GT2 family glycosyltransferase